ncbi:hypothetical protein D3C85_1115800 [compost metagenome]
MRQGRLPLKFKQANDDGHGGTDFMAHGRQECTFGLVGLLGLLAGFNQRCFQLLALGNVDPAAQQALQLAVGTVERHGPLVGVGALALEFDAPVNEYRLGVLEQAQVIGVQLSGQCLGNDFDVRQAPALDVFQAQREGLLIAFVAGDQSPFQITYVDRIGDTVEQRALEG